MKKYVHSFDLTVFFVRRFNMVVGILIQYNCKIVDVIHIFSPTLWQNIQLENYKMKKKFSYSWALVLLIFIQVLSGISIKVNAQSWEQFRGENRSGISTEKLVAESWADDQPELIWKKELGSGFSELIISEGIIYTMISETIDSITGYEYVAAFNELSGDEIWRSKVDSIYFDVDGWGNGSRATPTIDDKNIYTFSGNGKLTASLKQDGSFIWQHDFTKDFGSTIPRWGFASSPLLVDDKIIIEVGGTESRAFMAFNKKNGETIWASSNGNASHESPLLATIEGQQQIIFANGRRLYSFNLDGDTLWTYNMPFRTLTAIPLLVETNKIFLSGVRNPGFVIVQIENNKATEVLRGNSMKNDFSSSVYLDGHIYGFHVAALRCISADSGDVKWTKRGFGKGSLILVGDKLLVLSDKGKLIYIEATPTAYLEKGNIQTITGKSWTAASFLNGKVFVRNLTQMACYKLK